MAMGAKCVVAVPLLQFGDLYQPDLVPPELAQLTVPDLLEIGRCSHDRMRNGGAF